MRKPVVQHLAPVVTKDQNMAWPGVATGSKRPKRLFGGHLYASLRGVLLAIRVYRVRSLLIASGPLLGTAVATIAIIGVTSVLALPEETRYTRLIILLCVGSALVALLVGSYLCMQGMLAAVAARVSEIRLRRVVGARGRDIGYQVVMEVLLLSSIGTVVGLISGLLIGSVMALLLQLSPVVSPILLLVVCCGSIVAAGIGGIYPAVCAARMERAA